MTIGPASRFSTIAAQSLAAPPARPPSRHRASDQYLWSFELIGDLAARNDARSRRGTPNRSRTCEHGFREAVGPTRSDTGWRPIWVRRRLPGPHLTWRG